jgi:cysteine desulfurase family protein (TIGR01976 family)
MSQLESILPQLRSKFPSLSRIDPHLDRPVVYLDGPAGSQVPQSVIDAVSDTYLHHNANSGGMFATSQEVGRLMSEARQAAADWFGSDDPDECVFGANMTTITFAFSRALSKTWKAGERILVTQLDHDGNVTPWRMAAEDAGVQVETVQINTQDATLNYQDFDKKLVPGTRLVAFTAASNSVGSITDIKGLAERAHSVGAEVYVDAVHWAPHRLVDVVDWDVDYCVCSAYKFFGPHVGLLWGRKNRLEQLTPYKLRPAPNYSPGKWMTGTQNFAAIAGVQAAIDYVASIAELAGVCQEGLCRRSALQKAFSMIIDYENKLIEKLIVGLNHLPGLHLFGISQPNRISQRVPTVSFVIDGIDAIDVASHLASRGIYCWHGDYYAVDVCRALGQSERGMVRLGILHTTTEEEIERVLEELDTLTHRH